MCGIVGLVSLGRPLYDNAPALVELMLKRLHHRGPDDSGASTDSNVILGNTRLSVVGVDSGHQPIANETGSVVTVMNGEIYNAGQLRAALVKQGHRFATETDTEVLVHLYEEEGPEFITRLEGMFAFAIFDRQRQTVLIGRDRFGMKPLVYFNCDEGTVFASEIKALKIHPSFPSRLSPEGISTFLGLMYIPDPWTAYRDVHKLRPGHYLKITPQGVQDCCFYDVKFTGDAQVSADDAVEHLAELIPAAVERHLMSDVPIATLLSGGLDSRAVTAAMWQVGYPSTAYTVSYDEKRFDEGGIAARWIDLIGGSHRRVVLDEKTFSQQLYERYAHLDEPYAVWVNGASALLAQDIYNDGFKVALTGEGGDEFFCGYPTLHAANVAGYYQHIPSALRNTVRAGLNRLPAGQGRLPMAFMAQSFANAIDPDAIRTFFGFKEVLRYADWPDMLTNNVLEVIGDIDPAIAFNQHREAIKGCNLIDGLSYLDIKVFLAGCSLVPNDNAFMSGSVETRMPLLDYQLVDFVTSLPLKYRFNALEPKVLLKQAMRRFLEKEFPNATREFRSYKKMGFEIPITDWINGKYLGAILDHELSASKIRSNGFFRPEYIERLLSEQRSGRRNNERKLQGVLALEVFLSRTGHTF